MLKLSTKGRYGLRAMIQLTRNYGKGPVYMREIAREQGFSRKYLHMLLTALKKADLLKSVRGATGGYLLTRPPDEIRVSDVFIALEGSTSVIECLDNTDVCPRVQGCVARGMWQEVSDAIVNVLEGKTLADLANKQKGLENENGSNSE